MSRGTGCVRTVVGELFFREMTCAAAINKCSNMRKIDSSGICVAAVKLVFSVSTDSVCNVCSDFGSSSENVSNETICGRVYGKESDIPEANECRAILPLTVLLTLCDIVLAQKLTAWILTDVQVPSSRHVGGLPGTQCLDIAHAAHLVIEEALDKKSSGAVATADIRRFSAIP